MTQTRSYKLSEEQRKLVSLALSNTILGNQGADFVIPMAEVQELFKDSIPETPLWRTYPEEVQEAIVCEHMDCENLDKHRAQDELDEIDNPHELFMYFADTELLAAVHNGDCCVDDFRDAEKPKYVGTDDPEYYHWQAWQLMKAVGMVDDDNVLELGLAHVRYDNASLIGEEQA